MNWFVIFFFVVLLTSRFFSETLAVLPKAMDIVDLAVIPLLLVFSLLSSDNRGVDLGLHRRIFRLVCVFTLLWAISWAANLDRVIYPAAVLFLFGMLEGPLLFLALNRLIRNKRKFGLQMARIIGIMVLVEAAAVIFVNIPIFAATGNPDVISGTFGNNPYQFSAFLIVMGGFYLGRMRVSTKSIIYGVVIQIFIFGTFILLQWRTATPAFFASYLVLLGILYGRRILRLSLIVAVLAAIGYYIFSFIQTSDLNLKYEDLAVIYENPTSLADIGKVLSYVNTVEMYSEEPTTILVGSGPGTYVSRANYIFSIEASAEKTKGVSQIIRAVFGDEPYSTEVSNRFIRPLYDMEARFGSMQSNNPASSVLAAGAETGIPGLVVIGMIYGAVLINAIRFLRYSLSILDRQLISLSSALVIGTVYLCIICLLDNYLEISRVTLPVWLLLWTVSVLVRDQRVTRANEAILRRNLEVHELATVAQ